MCQFGESALYHKSVEQTKEHSKIRVPKFAPRWETGVCMGDRASTTDIWCGIQKDRSTRSEQFDDLESARSSGIMSTASSASRSHQRDQICEIKTEKKVKDQQQLQQ